MKTFIVLIPVSSLESPRNACEQIEGTKFYNEEGLTPDDILNKLMVELGISTPHNIEVWSISDFMDEFNNENIDINNYFMSYVYSGA